MLASPVFAPSLWQASTRSRYTLFSCVMLQTRDLVCWLAVTLGLIRSEQRMKLLEVYSYIWHANTPFVYIHAAARGPLDPRHAHICIEACTLPLPLPLSPTLSPTLTPTLSLPYP